MRAFDHLLKYGIRPSTQRLAIMDYLLSHRTHPTSDEIYEGVKGEIPTLSKTTVYNTLNYLHEKGAVLSLSIDRKNARFDGYTERHAHFLCCKCGCVTDLPLNTLPDVSIPQGANVTDIQVYVQGICEACAQNE